MFIFIKRKFYLRIILFGTFLSLIFFQNCSRSSFQEVSTSNLVSTNQQSSIRSISSISSTTESISGDAKISANVFGHPLVISTASKYAGAIYSLTWKGKEFIDSYDHGRELQSASSFDNFGECYNPTEAGSACAITVKNGFNVLVGDCKKETSTSRLLAIKAYGNQLSTTSQMAFWVPAGVSYGQQCGSTTDPLYTKAQNVVDLSNHQLSKQVTIGLYNQNVIEYNIDFDVPEDHVTATFEALTGYMPEEFNTFWTYDPNAPKVDPLLVPLPSIDGGREQGLPLIFSTADKQYAMGIFSPGTEDNPGASYGYTNFGSTKKWNAVYRSKNTPKGHYSFKAFVIVGSLEQVKDGINKVNWALKIPSGQRNIYSKFNSTTNQYFYSHSNIEGLLDGFINDGFRFRVLNFPLKDTIKIYRCDTGLNHFVSADINCEGTTNVEAIGYIYKNKKTKSRTLYRYYNPTTGNYLVHTNTVNGIPEGYSAKVILGYVPIDREPGLYSIYKTPETPPSDQVNVYRKFRSSTGEHFFTNWKDEAADAGFANQGIGFRAYAYAGANKALIYRCNNETHYISTQKSCEKDISESVDDNEGSYGYVKTSFELGTAPLYRFYKSATGDYLVTTDINEGFANGYNANPVILGYVPAKDEVVGIYKNASLDVPAPPEGQSYVYRSYYQSTKRISYNLNLTEDALAGALFAGISFNVFNTKKDSSMIALYRCYDYEHNAHFTSTQVNCEIPSCVKKVSANTQCNKGLYGYIYSSTISSQPQNSKSKIANSKPLFRFYNPNSGDYISTHNLDRATEMGYVQQSLLGYVPK